MRVAAIIVAAGTSTRAGGQTPKQYSQLAGQPVLAWSVRALQAAGVADIVVAIAAGHDSQYRSATKGITGLRSVIGGQTRTDSVRAALAETPDADVVLIHDAARPGLSATMVQALIKAVSKGLVAAAPALPVADALLRMDEAGRVIGDLECTGAMRIQTPQVFHGATLRAAYAAADPEQTFTDDLSVVRAHGGEVRLISGDARLMKLTYPEDFAMLERLISDRIVCVGNGVDAHRFGDGDHVTLCGVKIPHSKGLVGHSDADAGWHALVDAILGALGEGDIGAHFPPSDPQWKGADSERFLRHAVQLADAAGARILHADITLLCERPKIGPHRDRMRQRTAEVLGLPMERVSVKATTTERMGFLGREEGLAAQATATVERPG